MVFYVATSLDLWPQTTYNLCAQEELPARLVLTDRLRYDRKRRTFEISLWI